MASRKKKEKAFNVLAFFIVLILAALVLLPIWWIFRSSLMSTAALNEYPPSFIPHEWLWSNYSKALETFEYWTYFKNTFTIIIPAVTFGTITAIFCGYAFARLRFRGKKLIFNICVGTILLPGMVTLIPLYIFWTKGMGLGDTYWPLIIPGITTPAVVFFMKQYMEGALSPELVEAARIDGCGEIRIFNTIVVPLMKPAIATQAIFQFVASWNNLFMPTLIISSSEKKTLTMFVQMLTSESFRTDYGVVFLGLSITILPMLVMYFLLSRFIVEGVSLGGVKG